MLRTPAIPPFVKPIAFLRSGIGREKGLNDLYFHTVELGKDHAK